MCKWLLGFLLALPLLATDVTVFRNVHVVDLEKGEVQKNRAIRVENGVIFAITTNQDATIPEGATVVEMGGSHAIPGLWDMNVKIFDNEHRQPPRAWSFRLLLANGVIGVREMWAAPGLDMEQLARWRQNQDPDNGPVPHFGLVGTQVDGAPPVHPTSPALANPDQVQAFVASAKQAGFDFIQSFVRLSPQTFAALAKEAKTQNIPLAGFLPAAVDPSTASESMRSIEGMEALLGAVTTVKDLQQGGSGLTEMQGPPPAPALDESKLNALIKTFKRNGTYLVPALAVRKLQLLHNDPASFEKDEGLRVTPAATIGQWYWFRDAIFGTPPELMETNNAIYALEAKVTAAFHKAGVPVMAGSQFGAPYVYPGFNLIDEIEALADAGLSNLDALRAATTVPANFLGKADQFGKVVTGARADLIFTSGNPLENLNSLRQLSGMHLKGTYFDGDALAGMRERALDAKIEEANRRPAIPRRRIAKEKLELFAGDYGNGRTRVKVSAMRGGLMVLFNGTFAENLEPLGGGVFRKRGASLLYSFQSKPDGSIWGFQILDTDIYTFTREGNN